MRTLPLHEVHRAAGARLAEAGGAERVESYGDAAKLSAEARSGAGLVDLSQRGRLAVSGPDRVSWLQGMVTADVKKLAPGQGTFACIVSPKGKLLAAARIFAREAELWLDLEESPLEATLDHLRRHLVMEECEVVDRSAETAMLGLHGPRAHALLAGLAPGLPELAEHAQAGIALGGVSAVAIGSRELGLPGIDLWLAPGDAAAAWRALTAAGATLLGFDATEILRVEAGRPRFGAELDEDTLPLEAGLERAISYDKGCYVGQEVIARMTYRGHANRKLAGLWLEGTAPAAPSEALSRDGKPVGEIRSSLVSARFGRPVALAYVRRESLEPGTKLALASGRGATVTALPFEAP
ncbi:MAG TPA: glycine cleavage T C-terminal barrel domain-containing protein [Myxococcales bacterium]|nr:glycine cleavage T C-terminal barrel domain-containing protein [Myxococcales bacterium]